jgi:hypothetical protein
MIKLQTIFVFLFTVLITLLSVSCDLLKKKPDIKSAQQAEIIGKKTEALSIYSEVLLSVTASHPVPDINKSKVLKPELWLDDIQKYQLWINTTATKIPEQYTPALEGIMTCNDDVKANNKLLKLKTQELTIDDFTKEWNQTFFAPLVKINPAHTNLSNGAFSNKVSYIRLSSRKDYNYVIQLLKPDNKRRIETKLYPESNITLMATPGKYLLMIQSTVTFKSGQVWVSPYSIIPIDIPLKSSLITADIVTSVTK